MNILQSIVKIDHLLNQDNKQLKFRFQWIYRLIY